MNETIIKSTTVTELKALVTEVEALQDCQVFIGLDYTQEVRLTDLQRQINNLIKQL